MEPVLDASAGETWPPAAPEPTNLLALLPGARAPSLDDVLADLAAAGWAGRLIERIPRPDDPEIRWCAALEPAGRELPVVVWAEPARPQATDGSPAPAGVASCRWVLGLETILDERDPLTDLAALMRVLIGAAPSACAVLDVNTTRWHDRDGIIRAAETGIDPPADDFFVVQVVAGHSGGGGDEREGGVAGDRPEVAWVHTHGLWRCGRPELEMLDVPAHHAPVAAALVSDVAALILEDGPGAPGAPLEIGHGLTVTLQPWHAVAPYVGPGAPGGPGDRAGGRDDPHAGNRAVICGREPRGRYTKIWSWPRDVIDRLAAGDAALYLTARATERQGRLARAAWGDFVAALARMGPEGPSRVDFAVKACFRAGEDAGREHLWFAAHRVDGERVEGALLNEPLDAHGMSVGDRRWIEPAQVSDWRVTTPEGSFGPEETAVLRRALGRVRGGAGDA